MARLVTSYADHMPLVRACSAEVRYDYPSDRPEDDQHLSRRLRQQHGARCDAPRFEHGTRYVATYRFEHPGSVRLGFYSTVSTRMRSIVPDGVAGFTSSSGFVRLGGTNYCLRTATAPVLRSGDRHALAFDHTRCHAAPCYHIL